MFRMLVLRRRCYNAITGLFELFLSYVFKTMLDGSLFTSYVLKSPDYWYAVEINYNSFTLCFLLYEKISFTSLLISVLIFDYCTSTYDNDIKFLTGCCTSRLPIYNRSSIVSETIVSYCFWACIMIMLNISSLWLHKALYSQPYFSGFVMIKTSESCKTANYYM